MQFLAMDTFEKAGRWLMALLCQAIYPVITWIFDLFMNITKVNILTSGSVAPIYQRITMILTIVMVFYVTFEFVKYVVQPDAMTDKEKGVGNIVYKLIAVVILIAFVPKIFEWAYIIQEKILDTGIIEKVILGNDKIDAKRTGANFSANIFSMFYQANTEFEDGKNSVYEGIVSENLRTLREEGSLANLTAGLYDTGEIKTTFEGNDYDEIEKSRIDFQGIFAVIVGGFIVYILVLYSIDVGTRWAQMLFLQLIAPIAIIGYLAPKKDGMFQKWTKQCLTTYLDLFLRLAIIYFILLICEILATSYGNNELFNNLGDIGSTMEVFVYIALVLGLLVFVRKAPKMLGELFPKGGAASGNFGLSAKDRNLKGVSRIFGAAAGVAVGAGAGLAAGAMQGFRRRNSLGENGKAKGIGAGIWGATKGAIGGVVGGATRGLVNGGKKGNMIKNVSAGAKSQIKASQRFGNREENGYGLMDQMGDRARSTVGLKSRVELKEDQKAPMKRESDALANIRKTNDSMRERAEKKLKEGKGAKAEKLLAAEKKVRDFKEDANVRSRYKVSKYKTDEEAYDAYVDAIKEARQSVNRQNFIAPNGAFNESAYEEACNRAANKVNQDDFKVGLYKTEQEAQDAFEKDLYDAQKELKTVKDEAINDYINNTDDGAITSMREMMKTQIEQYNKYASSERKIKEKDIPTEAEAFDSYVKETLKEDEDRLAREMVEIDAEIEAIKRQTAGSGINEGGGGKH